jgi:hypothetical protein
MYAIGMYVYTTNNIWILGVLEHAEIWGTPFSDRPNSSMVNGRAEEQKQLDWIH